jgi:hypothetical protein
MKEKAKKFANIMNDVITEEAIRLYRKKGIYCSKPKTKHIQKISFELIDLVVDDKVSRSDLSSLAYHFGLCQHFPDYFTIIDYARYVAYPFT